jgi:hypothetical protein
MLDDGCRTVGCRSDKPSIPNDDKEYPELSEHPDFLFTWFDIVLTPEQSEDLLIEIDWWLDKANVVSDAGVLAEALGISAEIIVALGGTAPEIGIPTGITLFATGATIDWTVDDLDTLRYELATSSQGCTQPVSISVGADIGKWGIAVNGEKVVSHWNIHPLFTPKGIWNATPAFLLVWFYFDLQQ